jgi:hypothetical protein
MGDHVLRGKVLAWVDGWPFIEIDGERNIYSETLLTIHALNVPEVWKGTFYIGKR